MATPTNDTTDGSGNHALTCIPGPIHCATAGVPDLGENELQQMEIRHFIDALAEMALSVARRNEETE